MCARKGSVGLCYGRQLFLVILLTFVSVVGCAKSLETWPWLAFIPSLNCTGAITDARWLITSARCFQNRANTASQLYIEVKDVANNLGEVKQVYVIDYTRDDRLERINGLTMLYLARTIPSLTRHTVSLPQRNFPLQSQGIVLSWSHKDDNSSNVDIIALSAHTTLCGDSRMHVCASLDKHLSSGIGAAFYCRHINIGSLLISLQRDGTITSLGVLHTKSNCDEYTTLLGRFSRLDLPIKDIRHKFRVRDHAPCQPGLYKTLDDVSRDLSKVHQGTSNLCDDSISRAWYRFTIDGQPAELPTWCPHSNRCGSPSTVWLPKGGDVIIGNQAQVEACTTWTVNDRHDCCFRKLLLRVRHCGDFKVYQLQRTDYCPTSYCANVTKGYCGPGKVGYQPNCRDSYPKLPKVLRFYPFYAHQGRRQRAYVYLRCVMHAIEPRSDNVQYLFNIYKSDKDSHRTSIHSYQTMRSYCDLLFQPGKVNLGDTIRSPVLASKPQYLGIKVISPPKTESLKTNDVRLTFVLTMPIVCPTEHNNCSLRIPIKTTLIEAITGEILAPSSHIMVSKCSLSFTAKKCRRGNTDCGHDTVVINTDRSPRRAQMILQLTLGPSVSTDVIWTNFVPPVVNTVLEPTPYYTCYAMSTSNIKTFSGSVFKHLGNGTFLLYKDVMSFTEVQMRKWQCNGMMSTCPCAVAVRERNDVIIADMCNGRYKESSLRFHVRSKLPLHKNTRISQSENGKTFTITLPSGLYLIIDEYDWGINILLVTTNTTSSAGLCRRNELSNTKYLRRIQEGESLFRKNFRFEVSLETGAVKQLCSCNALLNTSVDCSLQPSAEPWKGRDMTEKILSYQNVLKKEGVIKRTKVETIVQARQADSPNRFMSYVEKKRLCVRLNETRDLVMCKQVLGSKLWANIFQMCLEDSQEDLDFTMLQSHRNVITRLCEEKLGHKTSDVEANLLKEWKTKYCSGECQNGECVNGKCVCKEGFGSQDCSMLLKIPPTLFKLDSPICDEQFDICHEIFVSGATFSNTDLLTCLFTPVKRVGDRWEEERTQSFVNKAVFYSSRGVICRLPVNKRSSVIESHHAFYISVSNNKNSWSNTVLRVNFDSLCKNCTGDGVCSTKSDTCDIESRCTVKNAISEKNSCFKCLPSKNPDQWSQNEENLPPTFNSDIPTKIIAFTNELVSFTVNATDPENQPIKIRYNVPRGVLTAAGEFQWRAGTERIINFVATDTCGLSVTKYVHVQVRPCLCKNGGKCPKTMKHDYKCLCPAMYTGHYCEQEILPCSSSPCVYGRCVNRGRNFSCVCTSGYRGNTCDVRIPPCESSPCVRGACVDKSGSFRCVCPDGYGGQYCDKLLNPCVQKPCKNGDCFPNPDKSFRCVCHHGYHGPLCSRVRTPCSPNPCYGGQCSDLGASFQCLCPPKHYGDYCNITRPMCGNKPCFNGICETTVSGQRCVCQEGFVGERCDVICSIDCVNGDCVKDDVGITCACHHGYTGSDCSIRESNCDPDPCVHGSCRTKEEGYICHCDPGYTGPLCNMSVCALGCVNGICIHDNGVPTCRCHNDYRGVRCDQKVDACNSKPCVNGLCIVHEDSFNCSCHPGYRGQFCDQNIDPCLLRPCKNGYCKSGVAGQFSCICNTGYMGRFCDHAQDACHSNPCVHGTCKTMLDDNFRCECATGYVGVRCEKRFNICSSNPCENNGRCFSVYEGTFLCYCQRGYSGTLCEVDQRPCSKQPCFQQVPCTNVGNTFQCGACPAGFIGDGVNCRKDIAPSSYPCPREFCFPGVDCFIVESQIQCGRCPIGYYGNGFKCQVTCVIPCQNGGTCVKPGICICPPGFTGPTCAKALCAKPCLNGGRCVGLDKCYCPIGIFGRRCEKAKCHRKCLNGGRCVPPNRCQCTIGYAGVNCEQAICRQPCLNDGRCIQPDICMCPPGYFGARCQEGTCFPRCRNGGACVRNNQCACPRGYRGDRCQIAICQKPCQNGGRCFLKDQCSCPYGYWGKTCEYVYCPQPCLNGGKCIKPNVCLCPKNYAGVVCQFHVG